IPYITHPYMVGTLLLDAGCPLHVVISGYLHDVLEDTEVQKEEILKQFGSNVLAIVEGCSEPPKSYAWEYRKEQTLYYLESKASKEVLQVTCADKLHNIRSMHMQYIQEGEAMWYDFNRGKADQKWFYQTLVHILEKRIGDFTLFPLLKQEVAWMF